MAGRGPALGAGRGPAVRQPQLGPRIAAVAHEGEPFAVAHEGACEAHRTDQRAVRGRLVVEAEIVALVADGVDALGQLAKTARADGARRPPERRVVGWRGRIFRERVKDVGQHQFLVLLLVMKPDLEHRDHAIERVTG